MAMTPMMEQYFSVKEQYPDTLIFFRLGDFYEMFFEDAKIASGVLELVLTGRDCGQEERAPMCGVPYHSADGYIAKLISKGYKVAICEQTEDPAEAKGLVRREVVRVLTPGTVIESNMLDEGKNNYLAAICKHAGGAPGRAGAGLCFVDISTGAVHAAEFSADNSSGTVINELARFAPAEIILNEAAAKDKDIREYISRDGSVSAETFSDGCFLYDGCKELVLKYFKADDLFNLNIIEKPLLVCAAGAALRYLADVQKNTLENINSVTLFGDEKYMPLDYVTRRSLELTETERRREKKGSLLWVLDHTKTSPGKRLIRSWVEQPLVSVPHIISRQNGVAELVSGNILRSKLGEALSGINDMERMLTRIIFGTSNAKELRALANTISKLPLIKQLLEKTESKILNEIHSSLDLLENTAELINSAIKEDPPFSVREGNMINGGYCKELDELRLILHANKDYLAKIEASEQEKTGIKKLKIGYNRVFGYYIEVLNSYKELVPDGYIRKQTLSNCERYITEELKELETKVLGAQDRIVKLEYELFADVREKVAAEQHRIRATAAAAAKLDALYSLARAAAANNYERPFIGDSDRVAIKEGRHPVVEKFLKDSPFVPNDAELDSKSNRTMIITGPNMAGKSTYMRQTALIVLMAQIGGFVPAKSAEIGVVDNIFTRIGASDDLSAGQSTFMTEMSEVSVILKNATNKSLIIFDEIGRGTSTFDG
ncbi:MAG: DNA mismatch repair protein MutS, partial [Oscillospiraceae bacterium]|nr:DNA mismatch repair protein MutS [Oscillospiraceae bacterium]